MKRIVTALAAVPLLLGGLAACGEAEAAPLSGLSAGDTVDPEEYIDIVVSGMEESTTARMSMTTSFGEEMSLTGEGVVDYTSSEPASEMTMELPAEAGGGELEVVMVDGILYVAMGQLTGGDFWRVDPSDPDGPLAGMGLDRLLDQSDPRAAMEAMKPGLEQVTFVGTEDVDGRELDHYEITVDPAAAIEAVGAELPAEALEAVPESVTGDLWLDGDNRFARMAMEYPVMGQTVAMEMEVSDWGADVSIEAPPAEDVTDPPTQ